MTLKTSSPGGSVRKTAYDSLGRATTMYVSDGGGDLAWADAGNVTDDTVLSQSEMSYDADGNVILSTSRERFHDATGAGALGTATTGIFARVSYSTAYYDMLNRMTDSVDVGTNGGAAYTRPGTVPARSDTALVSSVVYDAAGRRWKTIDPRGIENRTTFDLLGRTVKTVENYVDGTVSDLDDKTTDYTYSAAGMTKLTARLTGAGTPGQTTEWVYGVGSSGNLYSNDIVGITKWPDPTTGASSSAQQEIVTVNALGQILTAQDRNGNVHTIGYDVLGRVVSDAVTTLGAGVDGAVRRTETAYDSQGNAYLLSSYSAAVGGTIVNQVQRTFNGLGQLTIEYQSHGGAVNTATTPKVQYAYSALDTSNCSRLTSMTYPNGRVVGYNYATGLDSNISRLSSITDSGVTLENYSYLGLGTVVVRAHAQPGVDLSYVKLTGEAVGDAGDQYTGLDRFGRIFDQRWRAGSVDKDRNQYTYDRDGNRLTKVNAVNSAFNEVYTYDGLNQVATFNRGSGARTQGFDYDALGNRDGVTTNGGTQTYTANKQNEITSISGATTPTYDANGNMTGDETGKLFVYDAWNRLVTVKNSGGTVLKTYGYDSLNHRVSETVSGTTTDLYYSAGWQVLEERVGGVTRASNVWSPVYVDAMIARDRDTDANGTLDERLYVTHDANFNVSGLINTSGAVVERYVYDTYGAVTVLNASWTVLGGSAYAWQYLHQGGRVDGVSGLVHFRNRDYSVTLGRWATMDPIRYAAGDVDLYRSVGNNSGNGLDPSGLDRISRFFSQNSDGSPNWFRRQNRDAAIWANRQLGRNEQRGTNRRVWIVPSNDGVTWSARQWHSLAASIDSISPFGETDHVIRANSPQEAYAEMQRRRLLGENDRITYLEFAGHGMPANVNGFVNYTQTNGQAALAYSQRNDHARGLSDIGKHMSVDSEVRVASCFAARGNNGPVFLMDLHALLQPGRVTGNDDWVAGTGTGWWWTTTSDGRNVVPDQRWGSFPQLGGHLMWWYVQSTFGPATKGNNILGTHGGSR